MPRKNNSAHKQPQHNKRNRRAVGCEDQFDDRPMALPKADRSPIQARNEAQRQYLSAIHNHQLVIAVGPAGVGKTWLIGAKAAQALDERRIEKIVITRPAIEAGEKLGHLPGEKEDKFAPFLAPFREVLDERLGKSYVDYLLKTGRIEAAPLAYMRGRTFKNAMVILDEAQNTTVGQMKMFLTRLGEGSTAVLTGDISQTDIKGVSGLADALSRISHIHAVKVVSFSSKDVVRSGLVQAIVEAYEQKSPD
ncbi:PhoH family protein [Cupriavidus metallidurans]|uniref:PhoH family protein n=1 Tax=Cupriavidus metallidurans TaxID=119219 RepID=UPI001CD03A1D|nr:PhoH family protein [Cupriavidus metallidurans]UBM12741.1 PhoH family protein [Cupriavidus metallidurans]